MRDFMDYGLALAHMRRWSINLQQFSDSTNVHIAAWQAARWLQKWLWNYEEQVAREQEFLTDRANGPAPDQTGSAEWKWKMFLRKEENWTHIDPDLRIKRFYRQPEQCDVEAALVVIRKVEKVLRWHDLKRQKRDRNGRMRQVATRHVSGDERCRLSLGTVCGDASFALITAPRRPDCLWCGGSRRKGPTVPSCELVREDLGTASGSALTRGRMGFPSLQHFQQGDKQPRRKLS